MFHRVAATLDGIKCFYREATKLTHFEVEGRNTSVTSFNVILELFSMMKADTGKYIAVFVIRKMTWIEFLPVIFPVFTQIF